jgi:hypothetical protein
MCPRGNYNRTSGGAPDGPTAVTAVKAPRAFVRLSDSRRVTILTPTNFTQISALPLFRMRRERDITET